MEGFTDVVLDTDGRPIEGATVTVTDYPSGTASALYSDDGTTPLNTNVVTTDSLGRYTFFATDGRYTRVISKSGYASITLTDLLLLDDPLTASTMSVTGNLTVGSLTAGRMVLAGTGGLLQDSTSATYSSNHFTFHTLSVSTGNLTVSTGKILAADGSAASPSISLASDTTTGFSKANSGQWFYSDQGTAKIVFGGGNIRLDSVFNFGWCSGTVAATSPDLLITRDAANTLAQRNGTSAQAFNLYNTFTSGSNYERLSIYYTSNLAIIESQAATGTVRDLILRAHNANGWQIQATTNHFLARTDNIQDIGASGATRPRTGYFGTSVNLGVSANNYMEMAQVSTTLPLLGPTTTAVGLIPDGAIPLAVTSQVVSAIAGTTGYQLGDGSDADRWGAITGSAVGTDSDNTDWTVTTVQLFTAANNVVVTAPAASFTGGSLLIHIGFIRGIAL